MDAWQTSQSDIPQYLVFLICMSYVSAPAFPQLTQHSPLMRYSIGVT